MVSYRIDCKAGLCIASADLIIDKVYNHIGLECLHATVFISYRVNARPMWYENISDSNESNIV